MEFTLFHLLVVFVAGQCMVTVLILFLASRGTGLVLVLFEELDQKLAASIQKLLEGGLDVEPVNPLQAAIAQMLIGKMNQELPQRAPTGEFVKKLE